MSTSNMYNSSEQQEQISFAQDASKTNKSFSKGFTMVALGAAILLGSCLFSLTLSFSDPSFHYVLYGATSVGVLLVLFGLGCCLGW